jgi:RND family efflux transporter MFP subunit
MITRVSAVLLSLLAMTAFAEQTGLLTAPVTRTSVPVVYQSHGLVEAVHKATMKAETSGRIAQIYFDVDDIVTRGSVIARFRNTRQKAELDLAEAGLAEARAEFNRSQADYERFRDLFEKKLVAATALDKASADLKGARARLDGAEAGVKKAKEEYENTIIRAPYSGIVTQRHVEVGEAVNPGSPLVSGISLDLIRAVVDVPQDYVEQVRSRNTALVYLPDQPATLSSEQVTIFPYANEQSHTFRVRVELPRGIEGLYPGMMLKLGFLVGEKNLLVVPASAIVRRGEVTAVYLRDDAGRIVMRQIRVGEPADAERIIVLAGLGENEQVLVDPHAATVALKQQKTNTPQ